MDTRLHPIPALAIYTPRGMPFRRVNAPTDLQRQINRDFLGAHQGRMGGYLHRQRR